MPRAVRLILPLILLAGLAACHTDPFSVKPEVRGVKIPEKPAAETPDPEAGPEAEKTE
jgi:hypothetical protein